MFTAEVKLWNIPVGVVLFDDNTNKSTFEFYDHFISQDLDIAPLTMPLEQLKRFSLTLLFFHVFYQVKFRKQSIINRIIFRTCRLIIWCINPIPWL